VIETDLLGVQHVRSEAQWVDRRCDRSAHSSHVQAALAVERADPHTSVTFLSYACSGASVLQGLIGPYDGAEPPDFQHDPLRPQIEAVAGNARRIDALLVSVGGNELEFADIVRSLIVEFDADQDPELLLRFNANLVLLPDRFRQLGDAIRQELDVDTVYIT